MLFPIFLNIAHRPALIVGDSQAAAAKADLLRRAGARVTVVARNPCEHLRHLEQAGEIILTIRSFQESDIPANSLVIVAGDDPRTIKPVVAAAHRAQIPVNVVDAPEESNFVMPAIIDRNPVVVAITTGGAAPVLARSIRAKIEALLPANLGRLARFADEFRSAVRSVYPEFSARRHFWERFFTSSMAAAVLSGEESKAREQMLTHVNHAGSRRQPESLVRIVFADCSAPDLLTLRGLQVLQEANTIVYGSEGEGIVRCYARRDAEMIHVNDDRAFPSFCESNLAAFLCEQTRHGSRLAWVKDVRTSEFVSCKEVILDLERSGVAVEIVPGVVHVPAREIGSSLRAAG